MPLYRITGPNGVEYEIEGPEGATKEQIVTAIQQKLATKPQESQKPVGVGEAFVGGAKRFGSNILTGITGLGDAQKAGEAGIARQEAITERPAGDYEKTRQLWNQGDYLPAAGEAISQIPAAISEQVPNLATRFAGARLLGSAGAAVGGPAAPITGTIGAVAGAFLPEYLSFAGANIERQVAEGKPVDKLSAYGTAGIQGSIDYYVDKTIFGKLLGIPTKQLGTAAAEKLAKESLLKIAGKGATEFAKLEIPTELAQQALERLQAGLPLTDATAIEEYKQTAYKTALSAPLGGVGRYQEVSTAKSQVAEEEKKRQAVIADVNATRAKREADIAALRENENQLQYAAAEREADLAGKSQVEAQLSAEAQAYQAQQAKVQERKGLIQEALKYDAPRAFGKTDTPEGIKDLLDNFDDYFYFKDKADADSLKKQLRQQLNETKRAQAARAKLSPEELEYTKLADVQDFFKDTFGVASETELANIPVERLRSTLNDLQAEQPTNKYVQEKFDLAEAKIKQAIEVHPDLVSQRQQEELSLEAERARIKQDKIIQANIKAREKELALFNNDPQKKAAFEQGPEAWAAYTTQEKAQIPDEAFPVYEPSPEISYEEKVAQLERARSEYEAEMFNLEEQYPTPAQPTTEEEIVNERIPSGQKALFTKTGKPTAEALRGTPDRTGVSQTQPKRTIPSNVVPVEETAPETSEAEETQPVPLGDVGRTTGRPAGRVETREEAEPAPLIYKGASKPINTLKDAVDAVREVEAYWIAKDREAPVDLPDEFVDEFEAFKQSIPTNPKDFPVWVKEARKKVQQMKDMVDSVVAENKAMAREEDEVVGYDDLPTEPYDVNDQYLESKKAKPKAKAKGAPKQVPAKLREPTTEPVTPEDLQRTVEKWFNPVWYKQAVKNGMLNIVDGDIMDSDLPQDVKEKYQDAKALFTPQGKAYFFTKNITKGNELGVILHEIGEHKGLENLIGKQRVTQLANRVRQMAEGKGSAREVAMAKQAVELAQGEKANDKELIAYFGEIAVFNDVRPGTKGKPEFGKALAWINELWNAVTKAIKQLHIDASKVTEQDIVDMLYGAARLEMGAAQTTQEQIGEPVPNEPEILASMAYNPEYTLSEQEIAQRRADGYTIHSTGSEQETFKEKMLGLLGFTEGTRNALDKAGNALVGPLYTIHRKATAFYGPEHLTSPTTGKMLGSVAYQHALNANNLGMEGVKQGGLKIDADGSILSFDDPNNIRKLNNEYNSLVTAIQQTGVSKALAMQKANNAILVDRYKNLKMIGIKAKDEFTEKDATEGKQIQNQFESEYTAWRDTYNAIRKNKEDFLVASGRYSRAEAKKLLSRLDYVPLYRLKDSEGLDGIFTQNLLSAKQQQKLQFDTKNYVIGDVMGNIIKNEMWLYKQGIFNHTTNLYVDQVEEMGGGRHVKVKNPNDESTIAYYRDGKLQYFKFDDPNDMAVFHTAPVINSTALRIGRVFGAMLRKGITLTPSFYYTQGWNDVERAWMQSGTNESFMTMLKNSFKEQRENFNSESETARAIRRRGVIGAVEFQDSLDNAINEILGRDTAPKTLLGKAYKKLEALERMAQNSDLAARAIVYEAAIKEGATEAEAAARAQMMLNYQHRGTAPLLRTLLTTMPFVNTRIQSEWRLVDAIKGNVPGVSKEKAYQILASKIAKVALVTLAYSLMRAGDDDYENESDEIRNRNYLLNVGGVPLRIPVAPEYLLLKSGIEQLTRKSINAEFYNDEKGWNAVKASLANLIIGGSDITPTIIKPMVEGAANYSFFTGRALVGQSLLNKETYLQYGEKTSELSKGFGKLLHEIGGESLGVSPIKIDNFINGVLGTMGRDLLFTTDLLYNLITGTEKPDRDISQYMEVGRAFYNTKGAQRVTDFYDVHDDVMRAYDSYQSLLKENPKAAKEYLEENRKLILLRPAVTTVKKNLDAIRDERKRILANPNLSSAEKTAKIDALKERANKIVTEPTKRLRERLD